MMSALREDCCRQGMGMLGTKKSSIPNGPGTSPMACVHWFEHAPWAVSPCHLTACGGAGVIVCCRWISYSPRNGANDRRCRHVCGGAKHAERERAGILLGQRLKVELRIRSPAYACNRSPLPAPPPGFHVFCAGIPGVPVCTFCISPVMSRLSA